MKASTALHSLFDWKIKGGMELRNLRVLVEVVRLGGFTEAARSLFSTQSTVSKSIRALEEELGVPLLHRASRKVAPTAAGEIAVRHGQRCWACARICWARLPS
jgi:DNA-binding transcriptional LysR family regulator